MKHGRLALVTSTLAAVLLISGCGGGTSGDASSTVTAEDSATPSGAPGDEQPSPSTSASTGTVKPKVTDAVVERLEAPWGLAFLPDGTALVTERDTAKVLHVVDGKATTVGTIAATDPGGEGGLLGIAISPSFTSDETVFLYTTAADDNRILKATFDGTRLGEPTPILTGIPKGNIHDGGRLAFGPDGYLYVSTGETGQRELAQDEESLGGKILRITTDGKPAPGNPQADSPIWNTGHRNVQGLAFDPEGRLWASEFGDQTWDELNLIVKGGNYGWPAVEGNGDTDNGKYTNPAVVWNTDDASPSGLAYLDGSLWMGALNGERLWRIPVSGGKAGKPRSYFVGGYGRIRTAVAAPDGSLWITTSNRDGRGDPSNTDDRILRVTLS